MRPQSPGTPPVLPLSDSDRSDLGQTEEQFCPLGSKMYKFIPNTAPTKVKCSETPQSRYLNITVNTNTACNFEHFEKVFLIHSTNRELLNCF